MGIYIKGINKEQVEKVLRTYTSYNFSCVEVPEPHGRLIDEDKIELPLYQEPSDETWTKVAIHLAPTVIEAEGKDD